MDAATRRRELRKRKILQNAEDRMKKLTGNIGADVEHDGHFGRDDPLKSQDRKSANNYSAKVDQNGEITSASRGEKVLDRNSLSCQNEPTKRRGGHVLKETSDGRFDPQTTQNIHKGNVLGENSSKHEDGKMGDKTDGCYRKERDEIQDDVHGTEFVITEPETVGGKTSNVRSVIVMILAILCFTNSLYLPALSSTLGVSWFLEIWNIKEFPFLIPFCILEIVFLFMPSIRKVMPGKQVNVWLLALELCGVSPTIVDAAKRIILEILEFLTDLAMFIFVLVILQSVKEFYVNNSSVIK